ncbi:hypothetical protein SLEP1_g18667 [Rubroshorea leprosula]|uniref:Thioredoxin domain-containing protein n=1 Tax=Rubroshorea leprosula TaxID=152421 RepID=A0AAV5J492_9ROSI|nr:hypothetical protein SLEP1_g18667 [Rubroshorea leprosula]
MPGITIGDTVPNLEVETTQERSGSMTSLKIVGPYFSLILVRDFTPACITELGMMAAYESEFASRGVKLLGLSCDDVKSHNEWVKDIEAYTPGCKVKYPIISDPNRRSSSNSTWWTRMRKTLQETRSHLEPCTLWVRTRRCA